MISENDSILIALSGGKDSVALLLFLLHYRDEHNIKLFAAHVNHMIRGTEADNDQQFCNSLCEKYNIPIFCKKINVPEIAKQQSMSLEETARNLRYEFFESICKEYNITKIATAHTASDNTETVLYNIIRGSGTQGICGIPPTRENIIRPLILCTKEQTEEYCIKNNISFCIDKTNHDDIYDRNNIRLNIIPYMKKRNPSIDNALSKLSYIARCDRQLISSLTDAFIEKNNGKMPLDETVNLFSDEKMLSCAHELLCKLSGITVSYDIFMQCKSVICSKKTGKKVKLSQEKQLIINYDFVEITDISSPLPYYEMPLPFDKITNINEKVSIHVYKGKKSINYKNINNFTIKATLNFDKICGSLIARKKINGDSYISGGITRSIKKYFSDSKISRQMREYIPVICDTEGALWVPGMNPCDRVSEKNAKNTITIVVEFENESRHCKSFTL